MRFLWPATATFALAAFTLLGADNDSPLKTDKDRASYSVGMDLGRSFRARGLEFNLDLLAQGLKDAFAGGKTLLTDDEAQDALAAFEKEMMSRQETRQKELAEKNQKEGETFLAENKKKEGVKTLPSGLQYKVIKAGTGKTPKATDMVKTHYRGTLIDGTEFDSSFRRNQPVTFPVNGVIPGWTEALQLMPVGSKWQLVVPGNLAYGEQGAGNAIGPNATLIFEVELLSIEAAPPAGAEK